MSNNHVCFINLSLHCIISADLKSICCITTPKEGNQRWKKYSDAMKMHHIQLHDNVFLYKLNLQSNYDCKITSGVKRTIFTSEM